MLRIVIVLAIFSLLCAFLTSCGGTGYALQRRAVTLEGKPVNTYVNIKSEEVGMYAAEDTVWLDLGTHTVCDTCTYAMAAVIK